MCVEHYYFYLLREICMWGVGLNQSWVRLKGTINANLSIVSSNFNTHCDEFVKQITSC